MPGSALVGRLNEQSLAENEDREAKQYWAATERKAPGVSRRASPCGKCRWLGQCRARAERRKTGIRESGQVDVRAGSELNLSHSAPGKTRYWWRPPRSGRANW